MELIKYKEKRSPLLKKLEILKIKDLIYQRTAALLWDLNEEMLPSSLSSYFTKANSIHGQNTRFAISGNLTIGINTNSFKFIGANIFNDLNNKQAYSVNSKKIF